LKNDQEALIVGVNANAGNRREAAGQEVYGASTLDDRREGQLGGLRKGNGGWTLYPVVLEDLRASPVTLPKTHSLLLYLGSYQFLYYSYFMVYSSNTI
jgi:hypothetical protein